MNQRNASVTVIGTGPCGTILAITLARNGHEVALWGRDPEHIATLECDRCNTTSLPDVPFPDTLYLEGGLATALAVSRNIFVVVPSHVFGEMLRQIKPPMRPDVRLVWATKELEAEIGCLLQDMTREALGDQIPLTVISGPTSVKELVAGLPIAISLVSTNQTFADNLQQSLHCGRSFRVYSNPNFIGVQLDGAMKNVVVIGAGMFDGIGSGVDACTALITRGLAETSHSGVALDADPTTFMGVAGLDDPVPTYTDNQSRNRRFDMMPSRGMDVQSAQERIDQMVESHRSTKEVRGLVYRFDVEMPITEEIYQVLYCEKDAREATLTLLGHARKDEHSSH